MKREIKFRMFHDKHMSYNPSFKGVEHQFEDIFSFGEWMQYTGLKDKNGKEIYEGDILESDINLFQDIGKEKGAVVFKDGCFVIRKNTPIHILLQGFNPEIIGNIHENPELL